MVGSMAGWVARLVVGRVVGTLACLAAWWLAEGLCGSVADWRAGWEARLLAGLLVSGVSGLKHCAF